MKLRAWLYMSRFFQIGLVISLFAACGTRAVPNSSSTPSTEIAALAHSDTRVEAGIGLVQDAGMTLAWQHAKQESDGDTRVIIVPAETEPLTLMLIYQGSALAAANLQRYSSGGFPVCHVPPGNPNAAHTIYVGWNAVINHQEKHGDVTGPCDGDEVEVQYANLLSGVVGHGTLGGTSEVEVTAAGHWKGTTTLEDLFTPVEPQFPDPVLPELPALPDVPEPPAIPIIPSLEELQNFDSDGLISSGTRISNQSVIVCPIEPDPAFPECEPDEQEICDPALLSELKSRRDATEGVFNAYEASDLVLRDQESSVASNLEKIRGEITELEDEIPWNWAKYGIALAAEVGAGIGGVAVCGVSLGAGCVGAGVVVVAAAGAVVTAGHDLNSARGGLATLRAQEGWYENAAAVIAEARPDFDAAHADASEDQETARDAYDSYYHSCIASSDEYSPDRESGRYSTTAAQHIRSAGPCPLEYS